MLIRKPQCPGVSTLIPRKLTAIDRYGLMVALGCLSLAMMLSQPTGAQSTSADYPGNALFQEYCRQQTIGLRDQCLTDIHTLADWEARKPIYRQQLLEMLGLDPLPDRSELHPTVTATTEIVVDDDPVRIERIHFQSQPGLYVTGNLYLPTNVKKPLPAILYVCGHGEVKKNGISYGNKTHYSRHGVWYARSGYVCLVIDSVQLGEIEGIHHGTHRYDMWWWLNRGYTPAGVEAWNCMRSLDYLETRPEVDAQKLGVTGRSGGGAYSWWIAALDDRIRVAVPVAGITDLENHVIDGKVDGHCDCMFCVNTYRWDYPLVAALIAPRPLLISNTDRDPIFPLEGVVRTHAKVRRIYELYGVPQNLALHITSGPHQDTQELQIHAFRWFNQYLRDDLEPIEKAARSVLEPEQLQVFVDRPLPSDARNSAIHEDFVAAANPPLPKSAEEWDAMCTAWRKVLDERVFRGWPSAPDPLNISETDWQITPNKMIVGAIRFDSERPFRLPLILIGKADLPATAAVELRVVDAEGWKHWGEPLQNWLIANAAASDDKETTLPSEVQSLLEEVRASGRWVAVFAPRGIGPTAVDSSKPAFVRLQRRLYLLGQTLDGSRIWDVRRAMQALGDWSRTRNRAIHLHAERMVAGVTLYAAVYEDAANVELVELPASHRQGPILFNVSRFLDLPQMVTLVAQQRPILLRQSDDPAWNYTREALKSLGVPPSNFQVVSQGDARDGS